MNRIILAAALLCAFSANSEARQHHRAAVIVAHERCNIDWPCEGVTTSVRGERVVKAMGGFGAANKVYKPRVSHYRAKPAIQTAANPRPRQARHIAVQIDQGHSSVPVQIVAHPDGCPRSAFCGCGAAVRVFGHSVRELWLAANWFKFPRAAPAAGMVAVRRHHVCVLEADLGHGYWRVYDANSGGHATRIHARSLAGYTVVNPRGAG